MSTHPLGTKAWDGQIYIMVSIIAGVQRISFMSTYPLGQRDEIDNYI